MRGKVSFAVLRAAHLRLGAAGEAAAARMFRNEGCDVLLRDYRVPKGEIDLIVRDGLSLVFAEVKTRRARTREQALALRARVHAGQKRRIYRASFTYMREIGRPAVPYRYDLVEVTYLKSRLFAMRHLRGYFGGRDIRKKPSGDINMFRPS